MEKEKLFEIGNRVAMLPALEERMEKLRLRIYEAEDDVRSLLRKCEAETLDVEQMKKDSLSTTLLKFFRAYEGRLNKETEEMIRAKLEYDKAAARLEELNREREELSGRISSIAEDKQVYEAELNKRREAILKNTSDEVSVKYRQLEEEEAFTVKQLVETDEAISAANRVKNTANRAIQHLDSAESWATYDVWAKGGIFSHMAKYDHIDNAQSEFNTLVSQMKDLQKELSDVNLYDAPGVSGIDSTTRAIDFWFDNIFTDLNVRDKIRGDMEELRRFLRKIEDIRAKLEKNKGELSRKLKDIERNKNSLVISF